MTISTLKPNTQHPIPSKMSYLLPDDPIHVPKFCEENGFYASVKSSRQMAKIKSKNTKPERLLRKALYANGVRFRMNVKTLVGAPDIVIRKYKLAVFVDGEFWHGQDWENRKKKLNTNKDFWQPKIERNMQRDRIVSQQLVKKGYTVFRFWQQDVQKNLGSCVNAILTHIATRQEPSAFSGSL